MTHVIEANTKVEYNFTNQIDRMKHFEYYFYWLVDNTDCPHYSRIFRSEKMSNLTLRRNQRDPECLLSNDNLQDFLGNRRKS